MYTLEVSGTSSHHESCPTLVISGLCAGAVPSFQIFVSNKYLHDVEYLCSYLTMNDMSGLRVGAVSTNI
jgi:hypothetical protein